MKAKDHYENHLGRFYSWMAGNFDEQLRINEIFFRDRHIRPYGNGIAFDLGCGHGLQTIALVNAGFTVTAVDFNPQLLTELASRAGNLNVKTVKDDIRHFLAQPSERAELIVCMGDTLTHLENFADVQSVIKDISDHLVPKGRIVFSFRDMTTELKEEQRFFAVRSDDTRILTCFLEYFPDHVMIYDLLYEKQNGNWVKSIGSYPKLRLRASVVTEHLEMNGIALNSIELIGGMTCIVGTRAA